MTSSPYGPNVAAPPPAPVEPAPSTVPTGSWVAVGLAALAFLALVIFGGNGENGSAGTGYR